VDLRIIQYSFHISATSAKYQRHIKYIGDFRDISATFQDISAISEKQRPQKTAKSEPHPGSSPQKLIKISHFHHLIVHNTHLIINKDRLRGFSLPLLLLLHSQLMYLVHIWIVLLHDLELYLLPYFPFLSFSFEDLPSHDDHTLHRLV
jgi:hypothetical protein